tara:strand:+ start:66 stop:455 length:390 start_codon:yes stop_codon:yes gene_type:complete
MNTIIFFHAVSASTAIALGMFIFLNKKGTSKHILSGRIWVFLLTIVSISAIYIQQITPGQYSLIHLLIPVTLLSLIYSIWNIREFKKTKKRKYLDSHKYSMISTYFGALVIAGLFTLTPGRIIHRLLFG